jgi:sulfite exporter TauE/SafE
MLQLIVTAFSMGLLGSFHCVGMCGPIALALPVRSDNLWTKLSGAIWYNLGRVITYSLFGCLFGMIGMSASLFGFQQWLSVLLGLLIILLVVLPKRWALPYKNNAITVLLQKLRFSLGKLFAKKSHSSLLSIGLLNGFLPCGLVYMAAAGAVATGAMSRGILFMAFFGLGTLPMMWSIVFFGNYIGISIRQKIRRGYPYMMLFMACLLVLRGMGLGIPYLSPRAEKENKEMISCGAKHD